MAAPPLPAPLATERIFYEVVDEWTIPNGGYGRVIVIDPKYRNEIEMKKLAAQLRKDTSQDRNAFIFIYDDMAAASRRKAAIGERLNKKDLAHHDFHMIGAYMRNANTGYHTLTIYLTGVMGPSKEIPH